jgi:hypothetical protein
VARWLVVVWCLLGLSACVLLDAPASRWVGLDRGPACGPLAGTAWSLGGGDRLVVEAARARRTAEVGVWQPEVGRCRQQGDRLVVRFGEEDEWRLVPLTRCAWVLHGPLHQRRELVAEWPCEEQGEAPLAGTRWRLPDGSDLVLDLDDVATDLDERFGVWRDEGEAASVSWRGSTWLFVRRDPCTGLLRTPEGDVQVRRAFPSCGSVVVSATASRNL